MHQAALPSVTLSSAATSECEGLHSPASPGWFDKVRTVMYCALKDWNAGNSLRSGAGNNSDGKQATDLMKRLATWAFYAVGALAIAYLALYAYAVFTGRDLQPGDPIHIFRKPDAPSYS